MISNKREKIFKSVRVFFHLFIFFYSVVTFFVHYFLFISSATQRALHIDVETALYTISYYCFPFIAVLSIYFIVTISTKLRYKDPDINKIRGYSMIFLCFSTVILAILNLTRILGYSQV
jgi:hypothetical protein